MADRESRESRQFCILFSSFLPHNFCDLYTNNYEGIYSYFNGLSGDDRRRILNFLGSRGDDYIVEIHSNLSRGSITMDSIFQLLEAIKQYETELEETENYRAPAASRFPLRWPGSQASYELEETENYRAPAASRVPLRWPGSQASYELEETENYRAPAASRFPLRWPGSQASYELEETENYRAPAASRVPLRWPGSQASYELEETENYRAPVASRFPLPWPGSQASYAILQGADGDRAASFLHSLLQGSQASYGILHATEMHPSDGPYAALIHTQSLSLRPAGFYNNLLGQDGFVIIPADDEFLSGHQTILSEVRATRDNETAGHSKLFKTLLPVNFTSAYKAGKILKSTYDFLQPSIKTSGYLTVAMAGTAVFSCLAGLSLSTFKPSTLPFGCNPQLMLQIMHYVAVTTTAYAFIGTMCHEFLQDDPLIMWIVEGLAAAAFMVVMVFIGRRI